MASPAALLVEDEALVGLELAGRIEDAGWRVLGPARTVVEAISLLESARPQIAFVDIQLGRETSAPVVARLRELAVPIVLTTAYQDPGTAGAMFMDLPRLVKPFDHRIIGALLDRNRGITYQIDHERRMVFLFGRGALRIEDALDLQRRLRADPQFDPAYRMLADYRAAISVQLDTRRLGEVAENAPFATPSRRAFVVQGADNYGILRAFQAYNEGNGTHGAVGVFYDFESATLWLEEG